MKVYILILLLAATVQSATQVVISSPADVKKHEDFDYQNFIWNSWQQLHYDVNGFDTAFLNSNFYTLKDCREAEKVLFAKINLYRIDMALLPFLWNEKASGVSLQFCIRLSKLGYIQHELDGTTPTTRM